MPERQASVDSPWDESIRLSTHTGRAERFENGATGCVVIEVTDPRRVDALEERRTPGVVQARRPKAGDKDVNR